MVGYHNIQPLTQNGSAIPEVDDGFLAGCSHAIGMKHNKYYGKVLSRNSITKRIDAGRDVSLDLSNWTVDASITLDGGRILPKTASYEAVHSKSCSPSYTSLRANMRQDASLNREQTRSEANGDDIFFLGSLCSKQSWYAYRI